VIGGSSRLGYGGFVSLEDDAGARAQGLAEMLERYQLLVALARGSPGRTPARRAEMRELAARFPGALREKDQLPLHELERRRDEVRALCAAAAQDPAAADRALAGAPAWLRYVLALHPLLLEILAVKRARPHSGQATGLAYAAVAERFGVSVAEVKEALYGLPDRP
jgi:hypothetical protein